MTARKTDKKTAILEHFQGDWRPLFEECKCDFSRCNGGGPQVLIAAPYREDKSPSLSVNLEKGLWDDKAKELQGDAFCFWAVCHDLDCETQFCAVLDGIIDCFGITVDQLDGGNSKPKRAKTLAERGISGATAEEFQIVESNDQRLSPRITFPVFDQTGNRVSSKTHKGPQTKGATDQLYPWNALEHNEVYLVNGEPAVWRAWEAGYDNVLCGTGGEVNFEKEWAPLFAGKIVNVTLDNDEAGRAGSEKVCRMLNGIAACLRVVTWPKGFKAKGDVEDWLNQGHKIEDLGFTDWHPREAEEYQQDHVPVARCIADIEPMSVEWLWPERVPIGHLTALEGDPGEGKSFLTQAIATSVTLGYGLPEGGMAEPANVLLFTAEDHLATTVRPRLESMGCDLERVFAFDEVLSLNDEGLKDLENLIRANEARLVVIDPIVAFLAASVDMHRANKVRSVLRRLSHIAERTTSAIVIVRHLAKGSSTKAIYRGLGSIDFTAACRSVLLAGHAPDDEHTRALVQIKSNLGPLSFSLGYSIQDAQFRWTGPSPLTAAELLAEEDTSRLRGAKDFLAEYLADGPRSSEDVRAAAKAEGISIATLRRAKKALGVKPSKQRNPNGPWYSELPGEEG